MYQRGFDIQKNVYRTFGYIHWPPTAGSSCCGHCWLLSQVSSSSRSHRLQILLSIVPRLACISLFARCCSPHKERHICDSMENFAGDFFKMYADYFAYMSAFLLACPRHEQFLCAGGQKRQLSLLCCSFWSAPVSDFAGKEMSGKLLLFMLMRTDYQTGFN